MINQVFETSKLCKPRTRYEVLAKAMEELGELAQEIIIDEGFQERPAGKDGVIGECADVINCIIDIIYLTDPTMTDDKFSWVMGPKLAKWKAYAAKQST